jgi:hypothetical protein
LESSNYEYQEIYGKVTLTLKIQINRFGRGEVDGTASGCCPPTQFGIISNEISVPANKGLVN